ncbi:MAG: hypothetical protein ACK4ZS_03335 [Sulfurimicrobium sp.]
MRKAKAAVAMLSCILLAKVNALQSIPDEELSSYSGQAFVWADRIAPNSLPGQMGAGSATDFTFFRMGLDAELAMNMNMAKLQLGCGGINDGLPGGGPACDVDMDYVRFMGRNGDVAGNPVTSNFVLRRPYIEIAFKNENNPALREVVGIKIGAQMADGYVSVGRKYESGTNIEHGGTCNSSASVLSPPGQLNCHSGINSLSGFVGAELSATLPLTVIGSSGYGCAGNTSFTGDDCGPAETLYIDYAGTRMNQLELADLLLKLNGGLAGIIGTGYARLIANTRVLHGFALVNTSDFFMSFQRQQVAYPRYTKTIPTVADTPVCGTPANPDRCNSAYAVPANPGWWLNIPSAKLTNAMVDRVTVGFFDLGTLLSALARPGMAAYNPDFNINPASNCYGGTLFC